MNTDTTTETGILASKSGQLAKAAEKAEKAAAEAARLKVELQLTRDGFVGRYYSAQQANSDLHECEVTIQRMKNTIPKMPPEGIDIAEFLADLPPQKLAEMAGQHFHQTLPGIALLEKVRAIHLRRFEEAADAVESYASEVGIPAALVVQFAEWRAMNPEQRNHPTNRPNFQQ
jgi:hypothetical protein